MSPMGHHSPLFGNKVRGYKKITLVEKEEKISLDKKIYNIFSKFYKELVRNMKIQLKD